MTTYAYDNWIQLPTRDLYDTQVMAMAINAAKDMYEKGEQRIKDFNTAYGDFVTPIQADQDWYNQNVTGKVRDTINNLYARGIDPLRSAEGRAIVAQLVNNIPVGDVAKLRSSAKNAEEFLKARKQLEAQGLYNPLFAKYDGPNINTYSTLDQGIWDKMSPTKVTDMATFGNPYFEGMKPNVHAASKNGIEYSIEKIDMNDLLGIANAHFNELVSTPQGQLMYKYYKDLAGGDSNPNSDNEARAAFNAAVADGQRRRIYTKDNYKDNYIKFKELELAREKNAIARQRNAIALERNRIAANRGSNNETSGGNKTNKELVSYYEPLYQNLVINTLNKDPMRSATFANNEFTLSMGESVLGAQRNIAEQYFGKNIYGGSVEVSSNRNLFGNQNSIRIGQNNSSISNAISRISNITPNKTVKAAISSTREFKKLFNANYRDYLNQFSGGNDAGFSAMFAKTWKQGSAKVDDLTYIGKSIDKIKGQNYVSFDRSDVDNIYSAKEIAARMAGITGPVLDDAIAETKRIRKQLSDNQNIVMKLTRAHGGGTGDTGQYGIYGTAKFKIVDTDGTVKDLSNLDAVFKTPFMSTPNPNAAKDDNLNLTFDQNLDLERNIMDNAAARSFGVTSNSGSIDATLPSPKVWYDPITSDFDSDFDFDF